MRTFLSILFLCGAYTLNAQSDLLANDYFKKGEFQKALVLYKNLHENNPNRTFFISKILACYWELEDYNSSEKLLKKTIKRLQNNPSLLVDLGYNYQLQGKKEKATENYQLALSQIEINTQHAYLIGQNFENKVLLDYAIKTYERAMEIDPKYNFLYPLARLYGEQRETEKMLQNYVDYVERSPNSLSSVWSLIQPFLKENPQEKNNILLKKYILVKNKKMPTPLWNLFLARLFKTQKEYYIAYLQYNAAYLKTKNESILKKTVELASISKKNGKTETAKKILTHLKTIDHKQISLEASLKLLKINIEQKTISLEKIQKQYLALNTQFYAPRTKMTHKIEYARFLTYQMGMPKKAIKVLDTLLSYPISINKKNYIQLLQGDFLLKEGRFSEALMKYAIVQEFSDDYLSLQARYKAALVSYYKGDFSWAEKLLDMLKSSTENPIANDALKLRLLITDNKPDDSPTGLKLYAKADFLNTIDETKQAIDTLNQVLLIYKGTKIEDDALYLQALIFDDTNQFEKAIKNHSKIISYHSKGILSDDAWYQLSVIYKQHLPNIEKEKECYEQLIFNFPNSVYFVEAKTQYREIINSVKTP